MPGYVQTKIDAYPDAWFTDRIERGWHYTTFAEYFDVDYSAVRDNMMARGLIARRKNTSSLDRIKNSVARRLPMAIVEPQSPEYYAERIAAAQGRAWLNEMED